MLWRALWCHECSSVVSGNLIGWTWEPIRGCRWGCGLWLAELNNQSRCRNSRQWPTLWYLRRCRGRKWYNRNQNPRSTRSRNKVLNTCARARKNPHDMINTRTSAVPLKVERPVCRTAVLVVVEKNYRVGCRTPSLWLKLENQWSRGFNADKSPF